MNMTHDGVQKHEASAVSVTRSGAAGQNPMSSRRLLVALIAVCMLLTACGSDAPETATQAEESVASAVNSESADSAADDTNSVDVASDAPDAGDTDADTDPTAGADNANATADGDSSGDASGAEAAPGLDEESIGDRGLRVPGEERPEGDESEPVDPSVTPTAAPAPTATPEPEQVSVEPTPTPAPTPTPPPQNDPVGQPPTQLPQGPVPSDDLEIQGPPTDDGSEIQVFSEAGVLACATTEAAIEFLDRGDLTRTEEALQSAGALASSASEPAIAALASQLSTTGRDSDASFDAIVAMLSACAQYGYEV